MTKSARSNSLTLVKPRTTWVITSKTSPTNPIEPSGSSQHTLVVNPWSKTRSNPTWTLTSANVFQNFCRVLQISPKHFKIYQYESCPVCRGTQLSYRLTFQILSGKGWKTWSTANSSCLPKQSDIQSLAAIYAKSVEKNTLEPLYKLQRVVRSTTFLFTTLCTSIQIFADFRVRTGVLWNMFEPVDAAPRHATPPPVRPPFVWPQAPWGAAVGPPVTSSHASTIKRPPPPIPHMPSRPSSLCPARAPPLEAAVASTRAGPPHCPTKASTTSSGICWSSPTRSLFPPSRRLAGAELPAVAASCAVVRPRRQSLFPNEARKPNPGTCRTFPARARPTPPQEFAGFRPPAPLAIARGRIARSAIFLRSQMQSKGISVRTKVFPGVLVKSCNFNSSCDLLNVVK
jgi:hypothetical protein